MSRGAEKGQGTLVDHRELELDPRLVEAVRRLVELFRPERVYLFGSQARGEANEDSDYDLLLVVSESDLSAYERDQEGYRALRGVRLPIDLLVFTRAEFERYLPAAASLASTVVREGRLLYVA
ncbi:MAG: nucleotidyltransferase domain-containing protein [Chloroflexi bacterium]|nr:nucleotidyltransferase domain-containing protein [Chloroflexota bacterium]